MNILDVLKESHARLYGDGVRLEVGINDYNLFSDDGRLIAMLEPDGPGNMRLLKDLANAIPKLIRIAEAAKVINDAEARGNDWSNADWYNLDKALSDLDKETT